MLMTGILLNGMPPMQLPPSVGRHPDFVAAVLDKSGDGAPDSILCEVRSSHVHQLTVRVVRHGKTFDVEQWQLLSSGCASLGAFAATRARTAEAGPSVVHEMRALDADSQYRAFGYPRWVSVRRPAHAATGIAGAPAFVFAPRTALSAAMAGLGIAAGDVLEHCNVQYGPQCYAPGSGGRNDTETGRFRTLDVALREALGSGVPDVGLFVLLPDVPRKGAPDALVWVAPPPPAAGSGMFQSVLTARPQPRSLGLFIEVAFSHESGGPGTAPLLQLFQLIDQGRCAQRVLVYASDTRRVCRALQPAIGTREAPWTEGCEWAGGDALGVATGNQVARSERSAKLLDRSLTELGGGEGPMAIVGGPESELGEPVFTSCGVLLAAAPRRADLAAAGGGVLNTDTPSLVIQRDVTLPGGGIVRETFVPGRVVSQLLPAALSARFVFWARAVGRPVAGNAAELVGYPRVAAEAAVAVDAPRGGQANSEGARESDLLRVKIDAAGNATISRDAERTVDSEDFDAAARSLGARAVDSTQRVLLAACNEPANSALDRLHAALTRVEAASHILVWGRRCDPDGKLIVCSVELPRLGLSFVVKFGQWHNSEGSRAPGNVSLSSIEYSGYRLLNSRSTSRLDRLAMGIPFALLLESEVDPGRLLFLVPTYPVRRPAIGRTPFSHALRPIRRAGWLQEMSATRVYALPVHPSLEALVYNGAREPALLHVSLLLWLRQPQQAAMLLHAATLDCEPTPEQTWLLHNAFCSGDDHDPDAIAVRLRLQVCATCWLPPYRYSCALWLALRSGYCVCTRCAF